MRKYACMLLTSAALASPAQSRASEDDRAPPPPPAGNAQAQSPSASPQSPQSPALSAPQPPAPQAPAPAQAPQTVTLQIAAPAPPQPAQAPAPQTITLQLVAAPAAAPPPAQTFSLSLAPQQQLVAAQPAAVVQAAAPAPVLSRVQYPGPLRVAIGSLGERLAKHKQAWVSVPVQDAQVIQSQQVQVVQAAAPQVVQQQPAPVQYAPASAPAVYASPQQSLSAPSKHSWFSRGR